MVRLLPILFTVRTVWAQPDAADVLAKVRYTYTHLQSIHIVARLSETTRVSTRVVNQERDYEFAAQRPGMFRAWTRDNTFEALSVSDGANTWKALPKAKQWIRLDAGSLANAVEEDRGARIPEDFPHAISSILVSRYPALARDAQAPEILREEAYPLKGGKVACYVLQARLKGQEYELWIAKTNYLVLRDVQKGNQPTRLGSGFVSIDLKVREIATNSDFDDSLFSFAPDRKWTEVESLLLPEEKSPNLRGRPAFDFTLKSVDGDSIRLAGLRGKVVVLDFWATWCPPCRRELPVLEKLQAELGSSVQFLGINDEEPATVRGFQRSNGYQMTVLTDGKREVSHSYGIQGIPTLLVIDSRGVVSQHWVGTRSESELRNAILAASK